MPTAISRIHHPSVLICLCVWRKYPTFVLNIYYIYIIIYSTSGLLFINVTMNLFKTSIQTENHICYIIIIPLFLLQLKFKYIYFMFDVQMLFQNFKESLQMLNQFNV